MRNDRMSPDKWMSMVSKGLIRNFDSGFVPSKQISIDSMYKLSGMLKAAADLRSGEPIDEEYIYSAQVLSLTQLDYIVGCLEEFEEPGDIEGLTERLTMARDELKV